MNFLKLKLKNILYAIMGFLGALGFIGFIVRSYLKIKAGHGLDYYISGAGYKLNYIGVLTLFALIPIVLGGGWILGKYLQWRDNRIEEQLIEKRLSKTSKRRKRT